MDNKTNFSLEGKVALVTGASYGIGFAIAKAMAGAGATIVFNDIKQELVDKGLAAYKEEGITAHGYVCDVTSEDAVNEMVANIYLPKELPLTDLPDERMQFTLGMYGAGDFYTMKGVVEELFDKLGMEKKIHYNPQCDRPYLHPGRKADIVYEKTVVGYLGELHPEVADNYRIGERTYVAVLDMPAVIPFADFDRKYQGLAKYPAVTRDLSMVVPKEILVGQIEDVLAQRGGKLLESYKLFDIYEGSQILAGFKSVAYSITFRAKDHTLTDDEVNAVMKKILNGLSGLGIELRA